MLWVGESTAAEALAGGRMRRRDVLGIIGGSAARALAGSSLLTLAAPAKLRAQQSVHARRLSIVHPSALMTEMSETGGHPGFGPFFAELQRLGYVEGRNLIVDRYPAEGDLNRHVQLARQAVLAEPDVIFTVGGPLAQRLKEATSTVPIVVIVGDPIALGFAQSLAKPGGNITGSSNFGGDEIWGKRLELLNEIAPGAKVGFLGEQSTVPLYLERLDRAANQLSLQIIGAALKSPLVAEEYRRAFAELTARGIGALLVSDQAENYANRTVIIGLVAADRLPALYPIREYVPLGGLISYGSDPAEFWRHAAVQITQIFRGEKVGDIPFHQPNKFTLAVNLRTAADQGVRIPGSLLARADEVVE